VIVIVLENESASAITASRMPYLFGLGQQFGRADNYASIEHPSFPNYLAMWSGSTHGVRDDKTRDIDADNLSQQLTSAGLQWRASMQNYPADGCRTGNRYEGGRDGPGVAGTYVRRHNPPINFTSVSGDPRECAKVQPLAAFDAAAGNVTFVAPNLCNDMHDCPAKVADDFLAAFVPSIISSPTWPSTLLVITFDEGSSDETGDRVFTVVARDGLSGHTSTTAYTHYSLLRTIEDLFDLPCLEEACTAEPMTEFLPPPWLTP
jgi:phospholipase C